MGVKPEHGIAGVWLFVEEGICFARGHLFIPTAGKAWVKGLLLLHQMAWLLDPDKVRVCI